MDPHIEIWGGGCPQAGVGVVPLLERGRWAHPSSLGGSVSSSTCHSQLSGKRLREVMSSSARKASSASPGDGNSPLNHIRVHGIPSAGIIPSTTQLSPKRCPVLRHCLNINQAHRKLHRSFAHVSPNLNISQDTCKHHLCTGHTLL